jgi:hypothetical protein
MSQQELRALCHVASDGAWIRRRDGGFGGLPVAQIAVAAAERLENARDAELCATALAHLGNAHRLASNFVAAGLALGKAWRIAHIGASSNQLKVRIVGFYGSLALDSAQPAHGTLPAECFLAHNQTLHDPVGETEALIKLGAQCRRFGDYARAQATCKRALMKLNHLDEPRLLMFTIHNLAHLYWSVGDCDEAWSIVKQNQPLVDAIGTSTERAKIEWLSANVSAHLGDEDGVKRLIAVFRIFIATCAMHESALVALDIAAQCTRFGRFPEARWFAAEALRSFQILRMFPEAFAALNILIRALGYGRRTH